MSIDMIYLSIIVGFVTAMLLLSLFGQVLDRWWPTLLDDDDLVRLDKDGKEIDNDDSAQPWRNHNGEKNDRM